MIEATKSVRLFLECELGRLGLPNSPKPVELRALLEGLKAWKEVHLEVVVAIIIFGSAIERSYYEVEKRFLFWKYLKRVSRPAANDVDFLVITKKNLTSDLIFRVARKTCVYEGEYGSHTLALAPGLHLIQRGLGQFVEGVNTGLDNVSLDAFRKGVVLAADSEFLDALGACQAKRKPVGVLRWQSDLPLHGVVDLNEF